MSAESSIIRRVVVHGRVQGVGFRVWTEHRALDRHLDGWVRNCQDGTVEILVTGAPRDVEAMIEACRHGPAGARVDRVEAFEAGPDLLAQRHAGEQFSLLPTR